MVLIGTGGLTKQILSSFPIRLKKKNKLRVFNDTYIFRNETSWHGIEVLHDIDQLYNQFKINPDFICSISTKYDRVSLINQFKSLGGIPTSYIAENSSVCTGEIGRGSIILQNCIIESNTNLGEFVIINNGSIVSHDSTIGYNTEICPRVTLTGNVSIGENCFIGTGAVITPGVSVVSNCTIGASSLVLKDISNPGKYFGVLS